MVIHIPEKDISPFTVGFAGFHKLRPTHVPGDGFYVKTDGAVFIFYTYPGARAALLVRDADASTISSKKIPCVTGSVEVIYSARKWRVDMLRRLSFFLATCFPDTVYQLPAGFWYKASALIDVRPHKYNNAMTLLNITSIARSYGIMATHSFDRIIDRK